MGKGRDIQFPWRTVVLKEVPWVFAFFDVASVIFRLPVNMIWAHFTNPRPTRRAVFLLDLVKCDKSALWSSCSNCTGKSLADSVKEYSSTAKQFIVEDEGIRRLIKSRLDIDSTDVEEGVVREVGWGLRNALPFISECFFDLTLSPQYYFPLCQGFEVLMKKHQIVIPTEAVDKKFLACAGTLQRFEEISSCHCVHMRKACAELVPGITIKDNFRYVEVMAKILTPWLVDEEWDSSKWSTAGEPWFTPDEMQKIVAEDAAADDARKKVKCPHKLAAMIKDNLDDYRYLSKCEGKFLQLLRSLAEAKARRGQKRSHTEMAGQEVVEVAPQGRKGENGADVTEEK